MEVRDEKKSKEVVSRVKSKQRNGRDTFSARSGLYINSTCKAGIQKTKRVNVIYKTHRKIDYMLHTPSEY